MRFIKFCSALIILVLFLSLSTNTFAQKKVYGHWSIKVVPGMEQAYYDLIATEGLPLFKGNSEMVGWWKTLIGNLYEMITIWEYKDITTFENGIKTSADNKMFQRFARERNTLITGETSEFLQLPEWATPPDKPIKANVIIHETHKVKMGHMEPYLEYLRKEGLPELAKVGFKIVGPFIQHSGNSDELLILVCFENLAERDTLLGKLGGAPVGKTFGAALNEHVDSFHIKVITPAPFMK